MNVITSELVDYLNTVTLDAGNIKLIPEEQERCELLADFYVNWLISNNSNDPPIEFINLAAELNFYNIRKQDILLSRRVYETDLRNKRRETLAILPKSVDQAMTETGTGRTVDLYKNMRSEIDELFEETQQQMSQSINSVLEQCEKQISQLTDKLRRLYDGESASDILLDFDHKRENLILPPSLDES